MGVGSENFALQRDQDTEASDDATLSGSAYLVLDIPTASWMIGL